MSAPAPFASAPLRVTLNESSGPVSPRFQYALTVEVSAIEAGGAWVRVTNRRPAAAGGDVEAQGSIDDARLRRFVAQIAVAPLDDLVPTDGPRVGVSVNRVEIGGGGVPACAFSYLLNRLETPEGERARDVVEAIKALSAEIAPLG